MTACSIEDIKSYLESEDGGRFLLNALAGARSRETQRWYNPPEQSWTREKEEEQRRQRIKEQLETPINLSMDRSDLENLVKFNETRSGEHQLVLVTDQGCRIIQHRPGTAIPPLPVLQSGYFPGIIRDGNGICYDNRKQAYRLTLID